MIFTCAQPPHQPCARDTVLALRQPHGQNLCGTVSCIVGRRGAGDHAGLGNLPDNGLPSVPNLTLGSSALGPEH